MTSDDLLLPPGTCLVHAGMPKTGTTALQIALHHRRDQLGKHGVTYASDGQRHPIAAIFAALGRQPQVGMVPDLAQWQRMVKEANEAGEAKGRAIVSSESFAAGEDDKVRAAAEQLGLDRVHIVLTLRPVLRIMPSAWQQYVQDRMRLSYEDWLDAMFNKPPYADPTPSFWRRTVHERQVQRWADIVGADRVTVVVAREGDRELLPRTFESFLGLPQGTLDPVPGRITNRSLTLAETEIVRLLNIEFKRRWTNDSYARLVRAGVVRELLKHPPASGAAKAVTPQWALDRAAEVDARAAEAIRSFGVRIVGDLTEFGKVPPELVEAAANASSQGPLSLPPEVATWAVIGLTQASKAAKPVGKSTKPAKSAAAGGTPTKPGAESATGDVPRGSTAADRIRALARRGRRTGRGNS